MLGASLRACSLHQILLIRLLGGKIRDILVLWHHIEPQNLLSLKKYMIKSINLTLPSPPLNIMTFCKKKFSLIFTERNPLTFSASPGPCIFLRADEPWPSKFLIPGPAADCGGKGLVPVRHRSITRCGCTDVPSWSQLQKNAPYSTQERNHRKHQKTFVLKINRCIKQEKKTVYS